MDLHLRHDGQGRTNGSGPRRCIRLWSGHLRRARPTANSHMKSTSCEVVVLTNVVVCVDIRRPETVPSRWETGRNTSVEVKICKPSHAWLHKEHHHLQAGGITPIYRWLHILNSVALSRARKGFIISNHHKMLSAPEEVADAQHFLLQRSWVIEANDLRLRFIVSMNGLHTAQSDDS
jgi:hypothetical protein